MPKKQKSKHKQKHKHKHKQSVSEKQYSVQSTTCSCFGSKSKGSKKKKKESQPIIDIPPTEEKYEYVIEKLAIKRIPVREISTSQVQQYKKLDINRRHAFATPVMVEPPAPAPPSSPRPANRPKQQKPRPREHARNVKDEDIEQEREMVSHLMESLSTLETGDNNNLKQPKRPSRKPPNVQIPPHPYHMNQQQKVVS